MKNFKIFYKTIICVAFYLFYGGLSVGYGQSNEINNVKAAIKAGSSKELTKYFSDVIEMDVEGGPASYSKTQAEFVLKDFFKKYPPIDFQYIHQGASKEGIKYAIGKYSYDDGSFRVLFRAKEIEDMYKVYNIEFKKE